MNRTDQHPPTGIHRPDRRRLFRVPQLSQSIASGRCCQKKCGGCERHRDCPEKFLRSCSASALRNRANCSAKPHFGGLPPDFRGSNKPWSISSISVAEPPATARQAALRQAGQSPRTRAGRVQVRQRGVCADLRAVWSVAIARTPWYGLVDRISAAYAAADVLSYTNVYHSSITLHEVLWVRPINGLVRRRKCI